MFVSTVTRLWAGQPRFDSPQGQVIFLFAAPFRPALGPNQPPILQVQLEALPPAVKQPGRKADDSPPSGTEVKNKWIYSSTTSSWRSA